MRILCRAFPWRFRHGALCLWVSSGLAAVQAQPVAPPVPVLAPVRVLGSEDTAAAHAGYAARRATVGTKTDTAVNENPQSVSVVTQDEIRDQGAQNVQDALNYAAGVRPAAYGVDNRGDYVQVRGGSPEAYLDGLRQYFDYNNPRTEIYALQSLEVLRGPASMLYGQGSTSGVLNLVSKRPLAQVRRELGFSLANHGRRELRADFTGPLTEDGQWRYRIVALGRLSGTQVQYAADDRAMLAPSLSWQPSAATSLTLQAYWQRDRLGSTQAFPPWQGTVLPNPNGRIPTRRFTSEPGFDAYATRQLSLGWQFEHRFNDRWSLRQSARVRHATVDYRTLYANVFGSRAGASYVDAAQSVVERFYYINLPRMRTLQADQHLEGRLDWGGTEHTLLLGLDYSHYRQTSRTASGAGFPLNLYHPVYGARPRYTLKADPAVRQQQVGVYVQDQIRFASNWMVVAGLRRDQVESLRAGRIRDRDGATTRRLGLLYVTEMGWSPYLGYSESFTPIAGVDVYGARWRPMRGRQVEAGLKYLSPSHDLAANLAAYDLREHNRRVADPLNPNNQIQAGKTRTRGVELDVRGQLTPRLALIANYVYTRVDAQLTKSPAHLLSVWAKYRLGLEGWAVGAGLRYVAAFRDGAAPVTPAVTLFDAAISYERGPWRYALNASNLADRSYLATCLGRGDCFYGARRTVMLSGSYRF